MNPWDYIRDFSESDIGKAISGVNNAIGLGARKIGGMLSDDYDKAKYLIDNTIPGNIAKNTWNAATYLMGAPQQAVFGFGKEGSGAFGKINNYLQGEGMDNLPATFLSAMGSIPSGLWGANNAALFSGRGNNIQGEHLTDGLFDNKIANKLAGVGIDLFSDPWGAAAAPISSKIGTMARTAMNLAKAKTSNVPAYEEVSRSVGIPKAIATMDISNAGTQRSPWSNLRKVVSGSNNWEDYVDETSGLPMAIRVNKPNINDMVGNISKDNQTHGVSIDGHTIANAVKRPWWAVQDTWDHETLHNTASMLPDSLRYGLSRKIKDVLSQDQPQILGAVENAYRPIYGGRLNDMLGEEALAHTIYNYGMSVPLDDDIIRLLDYTNMRRANINTSPATALPLDPYSINRMSDLYRNEE